MKKRILQMAALLPALGAMSGYHTDSGRTAPWYSRRSQIKKLP